MTKILFEFSTYIGSDTSRKESTDPKNVSWRVYSFEDGAETTLESGDGSKVMSNKYKKIFDERTRWML